MSGTIYSDFRWHGPAADARAAYEELTANPVVAGVLPFDGPRILDGTGYLNARALGALERPAALSETGPQLSAALIGVWA